MKFNSANILIVICCLTGCIATKIPKEYTEFRNGKYIQHIYNPGGLGHWKKMTLYIERNDSLEIVTRGYPIRDTQVFRIKWLGRCKYNLSWINPQTYFDSAYLKVTPKGQTCRIKKVTANYALVKSKSGIDTLWKVH